MTRRKNEYCKTPTIYQMEAAECGAASLAMILACFGKHIPLEQMRIETGVSRDGCNARNLMKAGKRLGLTVHAYRKETKDLRTLTPPCIIHWEFTHFLVLEGFKGKYAYLNDPAAGRRRLTFEELDEGFTGIVLTFKPAPGFQKDKKRQTLLSFIKTGLAGRKAALLKLLVAGLLLAVPGVLLPVLSRIFIDDILIAGDRSRFTQLLIVMCASVLLQVVLYRCRSVLLRKLQKKMILESARRFLHRLFRLPLSFFDQRYTGDLTSRADSNVHVNEFLTGDLAQTALNILITVFYLILLLIYSPFLTLIAAGAVLMHLLILRITADRIASGSIKLQQDSGRLAGAVYAGLRISDTLKASGAENAYIDRLLAYNDGVHALNQKYTRYQQMINALPGVIRMLADILILMAGAVLVIRGHMTAGMLAAFSCVFGSLHAPLEELTGFVKTLEQARADSSRVEDILAYKQDERYETRESAAALSAKLQGDAALSHVSFGYSILDPPLIMDFSFQISCGSSIAFAGPSGCGKSTIARLISGLYHPWSGDVLLDGISIRDIPAEILCASVSFVSQNPAFFSGTIRDNLTMWNRSIAEEDIIRAAQDACIHDVILQKPGAYEYRLSEDAANLSGGERQRLEIARALVTNPSILILDEATSALDPVTEKQIVDNIKRRGCTCIIIAHRLSAIRDCDRIIVMKDGRILQQGTHDTLTQEAGLYQELMNSR